MKRIPRIALPAMFIVVALALGAWSAAPGFAQQPTQVPDGQGQPPLNDGSSGMPPARATDEMPQSGPTGVTGNPGRGGSGATGSQTELMKWIASFTLDPTTITTANTSEIDRAFLDAAYAQNTAGLQIMRSALRQGGINNARGGPNAQIRSLTRMMLDIHTKDQALLKQIDQQLGGDGESPALNSVAFLPGTPEYSLGFQTIDLKAVFVDRVTRTRGNNFGLVYLDTLINLHAAGISTAQAAMAQTANPSIQALAQHLAQEESFHKLLMTQLRDRLYFGQSYSIVFPAPPSAATPTAVPTATGTSTALPTGTGTVSPTGTSTVVPTGTEVPGGTVFPSETVVPTGTAFPGDTAVPTGTVDTTTPVVP